MKVTSQLGFKHDYATEFGGELGKRIYKYFRVIINGETKVNPHIQWDYSKPNQYTIDTCKQDKNGNYIFIDCKSRQECHKWIADNWDNLCNS